MSTLSSRPRFMQTKWQSYERLNRNRKTPTRQSWLSPSLGSALLIMLAAILLSACCSPVVIREPAPKLPAPDSSLMQPPLLDSLVPQSMRPAAKN